MLLGLASVLLLAVLGWQMFGTKLGQPQRDRTGLFTTLPILWNESADLAGILKPDQEPHWAEKLIAGGGAIAPLDILATSGLKPLQYLVIAQPRPLSPDENVALDGWVRSGGKLLLFADPMLTEDSAFALGDKRRPQDTVLLSPILKHWGLELVFDESQVFGERSVEVMGSKVPVNLPGRFAVLDPVRCRVWGEGLAATCAISKGRVLVLADAAVLERDDAAGTRAKALRQLLDAAFVGR